MTTSSQDQPVAGRNTLRLNSSTERATGLSSHGDRRHDRRRWRQRHGKRQCGSWLLLLGRAGVDVRLRKGQEGERRDKGESIFDADREAQVQHARANHVEEAVRRLLAVTDLGDGAVNSVEHEMQATSVMASGELWSTKSS